MQSPDNQRAAERDLRNVVAGLGTLCYPNVKPDLSSMVPHKPRMFWIERWKSRKELCSPRRAG